ncbi:MAG: HD domain-containing phosphohydrolase [Thermodesulfovibrionia bacterium]
MTATNRERITRDLINYLAVAMKTAQLHHLDNIAVLNAIKKFLAVLNPLLSEGAVTLELVGEFFHVDGNRVRYSMEYIFNYDFLVREFKKRDLGTIVFEEVLKEDDIKDLLSALISSVFSETPFEKLFDTLEAIPNISIMELKKVKDDNVEINRRKAVKKTYFNAVSLTKSISNRIGSGEKISLKKAKRVMESITNLIIEEESMLLGMTTIKDYDEYTYNHSVNVSILSITLGHRLGLSRKTLLDLGLSALLHDMGKIEVPKEILNKPVDFTEEDWEIIMKHPAWGALAVFRMKGIDKSSMSAFICAFEHHINYDLSGYPKLRKKIKQHLFSRIITIADQYDAMTSSRVYSRIPIPPDKALSIIVERGGTQLDPALMKIFINMIGTYPLGSLVMLDTNELGLVFESNPNPDFSNRPRLHILVDSKGNKTKNTVDLMEKDDKGNFKRNIVKTLDPNQYKVNLAEYLL